MPHPNKSLYQLAARYMLLLVVSVSSTSFFITQSNASPRYTKTVEAEFEDVMFDMKDAIVNLGLVLEHSGNISTMLERTAVAVTGAQTETYSNAQYILFCSAKLTHTATMADPRNISICPFIIYAYESKATPGKTTVGYRNPDLGELPKDDPLYIEIHAYLKALIDSTVDGY